MERPVCKCHGEPMYGNGGGTWRCAVKDRERLRKRYHSDPDYRQRHIEQAKGWMKAHPEAQGMSGRREARREAWEHWFAENEQELVRARNGRYLVRYHGLSEPQVAHRRYLERVAARRRAEQRDAAWR